MTDGDDPADVAPLSSIDDYYLPIPMLHWATRISPKPHVFPKPKPNWLKADEPWETDTHPSDCSFAAISEWFQLWIGVCKNFDSPIPNADGWGRSPRRLAGKVIRDAWRIAGHLKDHKGESFSGLLPSPLPTKLSTLSSADAANLLTELFRQIKQAFQVECTKTSSANWLTVAEAERLSSINRGTISRACDSGEIVTNGESGRGRRIDSTDFNRWHLAYIRRPERQESEAGILRKQNR